MIRWLNPGALAALAAVALPILIHLLLRRRAVRALFPSVRFIAPTDASAVRMRMPSDLLLLLVRIGIVTCAALALARPLAVTDARREAWLQRTTRAIVVDTSRSVDSAAGAEAADAEMRGAVAVRRFDSTDPGDAIRRASAWLRDAQPGLREMVVVSDFQRGAVSELDASAVSDGIGVRFVPVGSQDPVASFQAGAVLHGESTLARTAALEGGKTVVALEPSTSSLAGLEIEADAGARAKILRAVSAAGAIPPSVEQPLVIRFGAVDAKQVSGTWDGPARARILELLTSLTDIQIRPAAVGRTLELTVAAPPDSLAAARAVQAALNARRDTSAWAEHEPARIPTSTLASWTRSPGAPDATSWQRSPESAGRWLWLAAMALMAVESLLRRERKTVRAAAVEAHAA